MFNEVDPLPFSCEVILLFSVPGFSFVSVSCTVSPPTIDPSVSARTNHGYSYLRLCYEFTTSSLLLDLH